MLYLGHSDILLTGWGALRGLEEQRSSDKKKVFNKRRPRLIISVMLCGMLYQLDRRGHSSNRIRRL